MGVIGYDGRLRPAGRALKVGVNEFNPEQIAKIRDAQPKFVELATKLIDSVGDDAVQYGEALGKKQKRLDALTAQEAEMTNRENVAKQVREINDNENLTPEQKREAADKITVPEYRSGDEELDRRTNLSNRQMLLGAVNSIYSQAKSMEGAARDAEFGAFAATGGAKISAEMARNTPEILTAKNLDELAEKFDGVFTKVTEGIGDAPVNEANRHKYTKWLAMEKAAHFEQASKAFIEKSRNEAKGNIATMCSAVSLDAKNATDAMNKAGAILASPTADAFHTPKEKREITNAVAMSYSASNFEKFEATLSTNTEVAKKMATQHLEKGDVASYNEAVNAINQNTEAQYDVAIGQLKVDKEQVLEDIASDRTISEEHRAALISIVGNQYDKVIDGAEKNKAHALLTAKRGKEHEINKAGVGLLDEVKNFFSGKTATVSEGADGLVQLMMSAPGYKEEFNKKHGFDPKTKGAYLEKNYPNKSTSDATNAAILDFKLMIADLNMQRKGESAFALEGILVHAGKVFGLDSNEYASIASFAYGNVTREKNDKAGETENFMSEFVYKGSKTDWEKNATYEERNTALKISNLLREVPDEQFNDLANRISEQLRIDEQFRFVMGAGSLGSAVHEAQAGDVGAPAVMERTEPEAPLQVDVDAEAAVLEAELEAVKNGKLFTKLDREQTLREYWIKQAKELEIFGPETEKELAKFGFSSSGLEYAVRSTVEARKKEAEEEKRNAEERPALEAEFKKLNLPLERSAYTSFMGIGGHPVDNTNEIELGTNLSGKEELTVDEMHEVLKQYKHYADERKSRSDSEKEAVRERVKSLEEKLAKLKNTKTR